MDWVAFIKPLSRSGSDCKKNKKMINMVLQPAWSFRKLSWFRSAKSRQIFSRIEFDDNLPQIFHNLFLGKYSALHSTNFDLLGSLIWHENWKNAATVNILTAENEKQILTTHRNIEGLDPTDSIQSMLLALLEGLWGSSIKKSLLFTDQPSSSSDFTDIKPRQIQQIKSPHYKELKVFIWGTTWFTGIYGVGKVFRLEKIDVSGKKQEACALIFRVMICFYVNIHFPSQDSKYSGQEGNRPAMSKLVLQNGKTKKAAPKTSKKTLLRTYLRSIAKAKGLHLDFSFTRDSGFAKSNSESSFHLMRNFADQGYSLLKTFKSGYGKILSKWISTVCRLMWVFG